MVHVTRLLQALKTLPAELQQEVADFAEFLAQRRAVSGAQDQKIISADELAQRRREGFGRFKGIFTVPDDFDAPLDDFKEYI